MTTAYQDDDAPEVREYASVLGARLRAVRSQQHLSLHGVERKSGGRWKAVVIGSYERGDRAISVQRLAELASFYGVPVGELLPREQAPAIGTPSAAPLTKIVLNPERVAALTDPDSAALTRFAAGDPAPARRLPQHVDDDPPRGPAHARHMYDMTIAELTDRLVHWQVLAPESLILDGAP